MKSYAFSPADPNTIYAGYGDLACVRSGGACPQTGGVIVSHDSGQTWALAGQTLLAATIAELAVDPANAQIVYAAASDSGLYKTTDGGASWDKLDLGTLEMPSGTDTDMVGTGQRVQAISLDPANSQHILISVHMLGIFASQDSGATWQAAYAGLEPNGSILDIVFDPTNTQIVYATICERRLPFNRRRTNLGQKEASPWQATGYLFKTFYNFAASRGV